MLMACLRCDTLRGRRNAYRLRAVYLLLGSSNFLSASLIPLEWKNVLAQVTSAYAGIVELSILQSLNFIKLFVITKKLQGKEWQFFCSLNWAFFTVWTSGLQRGAGCKDIFLTRITSMWMLSSTWPSFDWMVELTSTFTTWTACFHIFSCVQFCFMVFFTCLFNFPFLHTIICIPTWPRVIY